MASLSSGSHSPVSSNITMNSEASMVMQEQQLWQQLSATNQSSLKLLNPAAPNSQFMSNFNIHGFHNIPALYQDSQQLAAHYAELQLQLQLQHSTSNASSCTSSFHGSPAPAPQLIDTIPSWEALDMKLPSSNYNISDADHHPQAALSRAVAMAIQAVQSSNSPSSCNFSEVEQKPASCTSSCNNSNVNPNSAITGSNPNVSAALNHHPASVPVSVPVPNPNLPAFINRNSGTLLWGPGPAPAGNFHGALTLPDSFNLANLSSADPAFAERAAKFSSYSTQGPNPLPVINPYQDPNPLSATSNPPQIKPQILNSNPAQKSLQPGVVPAPELIKSPPVQDQPSKKRKNPAVAPNPKDSDNAAVDAEVLKKAKVDKSSVENKPQQSPASSAGNSAAESEQKSGKEIMSKPDPALAPAPAPKPDFIHVRARRGQATDSHSLAERVRREKISERMKYLQDLVPGTSKVTGKAMMLDEIINYVQSLQRQVEFLSMKLAAVHPIKMELNFESLMSKELLQPVAVNNHPAFAPADQGAINPLYPFNFHDNLGVNPAFQLLLNPQALTSSDHNSLADCISQVAGPWDDDLQNMVQMGFPQTPVMSSNLHGSLLHGQMKTEL